MRTLLVFATAVLLAACSVAPVPSNLPSPSRSFAPRTLSTESGPCAGIGIDATLQGEPNDPRVAWLVFPGGGRKDAVWPRGFTARFTPTLQILDPSGTVRYRAGDRIDGVCNVGADGILQIQPGS